MNTLIRLLVDEMEQLNLASLSVSEYPRCDVCCDLNVYHLTILAKSLSRSAEEGCESCSVLKQGIDCFIKSYDSIHILVDCSLSVTVEDEKNGSLGTVEFYTHKGQPSRWPNIGPGGDISQDSSTDECISLAKRWLQGCLKAHKACNRSSKPPLPTRVIDVGQSGGRARLYITQGESADYVALSHCWGGGTPLVTTTDTLEDRKLAINFNESSKTFKDAVDVTRRLGIGYIWIDLLCIIQNSKEDWIREAARMSDVYNNATVTISADTAKNSSEGLFANLSERQSLNKVETLPCKGPDGQPSQVYVRFRHGDPFHIESTVHSNQPREETMLSSRGWVLQEELLSPRRLHFRKEEMSWICSTYSRCECRIRPAQPTPGMFRSSASTFAPSAEFTHRVHLEWPFIVADFTRRKLTYASDRLPAMSGLAAWVENRTTDSYFGGLLYEDMAFQLLWYRDPGESDGGISTRFEEPFAPSWAWTSITGPISYHGRRSPITSPRNPTRSGPSINPMLRVVGIWKLPLEPDLNPYGLLRSSVLQLYNHIIPVSYSRETGLWHPDIPIKDYNPSNLKVYIDVPSEFQPETWTNASPPKYCFVLAGKWGSGEITVVNRQAVCLLVRRMTTDEDHEKLFLTILTFKTLLSGGDSYVRVGLVRGAGSIGAWEEAAEREMVHIL